ncbi:MAG: hypothetical protein K2F98_01885, partial [Bacteroides sp.]|nr:hypothetical protein [Bacteroides sp.]
CLKIQKRQLTRNELVALNFIILGISLITLITDNCGEGNSLFIKFLTCLLFFCVGKRIIDLLYYLAVFYIMRL